MVRAPFLSSWGMVVPVDIIAIIVDKIENEMVATG
jgi:hypothetical protein